MPTSNSALLESWRPQARVEDEARIASLMAIAGQLGGLEDAMTAEQWEELRFTALRHMRELHALEAVGASVAAKFVAEGAMQKDRPAIVADLGILRHELARAIAASMRISGMDG